MTAKTNRGRPRKTRYALLMGDFWRNDKVRRLSLEARGLLATAWSYAADNMTDGRVPLELLRGWAGKRCDRLMAELGGFLRVADGEIDAQAHDWKDVNISAAAWDQQERHRRWRVRSRATRLRATIIARDNFRCLYCGASVDSSSARVDHVVPVARGGSSAVANLATACRGCNLAKGSRTPEEWLS